MQGKQFHGTTEDSISDYLTIHFSVDVKPHFEGALLTNCTQLYINLLAFPQCCYKCIPCTATSSRHVHKRVVHCVLGRLKYCHLPHEGSPKRSEKSKKPYTLSLNLF